MPKDTLLISDLHFTSKPSDEYRWGLFPLVNQVIEKHNISRVKLLGDLCDAKSGHGAELVNRIVDGIRSWNITVDLLAGNHDLVGTGATPFFKFLRHCHNVFFYTEISQPSWKGIPELFLPHTRSPEDDWKDLDFTNKIIFAHVSVCGSVYETGITQKEGIDPNIFAKSKACFSGDIHSGQQVGPVVYVGCPYRVRFNDSFRGGGILLDSNTGEWERIYFDSFPRRFTWDITTAADLKARLDETKPNDQVKVRMHLDQSNMDKWRVVKEQTKAIFEENQLHLHAFDLIRSYNEVVPQQKAEIKVMDFDRFCDSQNIEQELRNVGKQILEEVKV